MIFDFFRIQSFYVLKVQAQLGNTFYDGMGQITGLIVVVFQGYFLLITKNFPEQRHYGFFGELFLEFSFKIEIYNYDSGENDKEYLNLENDDL